MSEEGTSSSAQVVENIEISVYKKEACKVIKFKFVYDKEDFDSENVITFKPEMAHQLFGESECIFGYRSLSITINYVHNSCQCYVDVQSSGKIKNDNMKADDIMKALNPWLPTNFTKSYDDFMDLLQNEEHSKMFGEVIATFEDTKGTVRFPENKMKAIYKVTQNDTSDEAFTDFHARFETFIVWFIDAANFIDMEDDKWLIYYVYEEFEHPEKNIIYRSPVGFCTVYQFYAYPRNIRPRISQFFILPSHQNRGIGTKLYEIIARTMRSRDEVLDITVEEPTISFQKMRDLEDCLLVHKELLETKTNFFTTSSKKIFEISKMKKTCRRQMQRVYDILGLYYASENGNAAYKNFLENIKTRITEQSERESRPGKRFCNIERSALSIQIDKKAQIERDFKKHIEEIEHSVKYLQSKFKIKLEMNQ